MACRKYSLFLASYVTSFFVSSPHMIASSLVQRTSAAGEKLADVV
jgi:hypothetical protein